MGSYEIYSLKKSADSKEILLIAGQTHEIEPDKIQNLRAPFEKILDKVRVLVTEFDLKTDPLSLHGLHQLAYEICLDDDRKILSSFESFEQRDLLYSSVIRCGSYYFKTPWRHWIWPFSCYPMASFLDFMLGLPFFYINMFYDYLLHPCVQFFSLSPEVVLSEEEEMKEHLYEFRARHQRWYKELLKYDSQLGLTLILLDREHLRGENSFLSLIERQGYKITLLEMFPEKLTEQRAFNYTQGPLGEFREFC